ncbi:hypothetical protein [Bailinhaonella thermotolerans]|uniref:Uncharacterized protein n=1 Tax=Bailinhaonella thermotolerans TaxID=1070861 RepID=A0A3A4A557_9ACTN|nr:hypothetical protein [Bailinhaonella thermotolerans]RJL20383.1 hypothetical protein D5H75_39525 [Bailinhaonella thermotolerans]
MSEANRSIFREEALNRYREGQPETEPLYEIPARDFAGLWIYTVLLAASMAGLVWFGVLPLLGGGA